MLTESLGGKCPACNYDKMIQRHGSHGYYQLDGCPNCGFGYGSNGYLEDGETRGFEAFSKIALMWVAQYEKPQYYHLFVDDMSIEGNIYFGEPKLREEKAYEHALNLLQQLKPEEQRKRIFEWAEKQKRDDGPITVWEHSQEEIDKYLATKPVIFKPNLQ